MEKTMDYMIRHAFRSPADREKAHRSYNCQFGNLRSGLPSNSRTSEEDEPLLDLFVDEASVAIVAELAGIGKESIEVDATEDTVTISVVSGKHRYFKELSLPAKVDPKSSTASYKNGVLEVHLKKTLGEHLIVK